MSLEEAVVDAGAVRFRPMLLTAAAVVGCKRHPVGPGFPGDWLSRLWPAQWPQRCCPAWRSQSCTTCARRAAVSRNLCPPPLWRPSLA